MSRKSQKLKKIEMKKRQVEQDLKDLSNSILNKEFVKDLANIATEIIYRRTTLGRGFKNAGEKTLSKLKKLEDSTVYNRRRMEAGLTKQPLSISTKANKSNLTMTGHMLDELKPKGKGFGIPFFKGKGISIRIGYKKGSFAGDKAKWNADMGRYFVQLAKSEERQIHRIILARSREAVQYMRRNKTMKGFRGSEPKLIGR